MGKIKALVKWIGGKFDRTYTPDVLIEWISDFDLNTFDQDDEDISYIVEWREKTQTNHPVYDVKIIIVSGICTYIFIF